MPHTQIPSEMGGRFIPKEAFGDADANEDWHTQSSAKARENEVLRNVTKKSMETFRTYEDALIDNIDAKNKGEVIEEYSDEPRAARRNVSAGKSYEVGSQRLPKVEMRKPSTTDQFQTGRGKK